MDILSFVIGVCVVILTIWVICKTNKDDMGCDFDCKNCPFPPCSKKEIERMKKERDK